MCIRDSVTRIELDLLEPLLFASREVDRYTLTEPVLGNYALAYALGFANAPYRLVAADVQRPRYAEDLGALNARALYVTPGTPLGETRLVLERWNALSDSYWYAMKQNAVATGLEHRFDKDRKARPTNYPQSGFVRLVARGSRFAAFVVSAGELELPPYVRLGKWSSKARVAVRGTWVDPPRRRTSPERPGHVASLQNAADLERTHRARTFDLVAVPPVPLLGRVEIVDGDLWEVGDDLIPAGLSFALPSVEAEPPRRTRRRKGPPA